MGWAGIKNGKLLGLVEPVFDVFVTIDGNLSYQQNLSERKLAFIVLSAPDNTVETFMPLMPQVLVALLNIKSWQIVKITAPMSPE